MLDRVQELENEGYQFEAAEASFVLLVERLAGPQSTLVRAARLSTSASVGKLGSDRSTSTEATIKLRVGDVIEHTVSEGDGPVNALDGALRKALEHALSPAEGDAPGRLQGPRHQRPRRHGGPRARRDREQGS